MNKQLEALIMAPFFNSLFREILAVPNEEKNLLNLAYLKMKVYSLSFLTFRVLVGIVILVKYILIEMVEKHL